MKRIVATALVVTLSLSFAWRASAGEDEPKDKVQTIGKNGLKISGKVTDDDKKFDFELNFQGKDFTLPMQAKSYSVKLEAGKKYTITMDTDDDDFDPFLVLKDAGGKTVGFDDDGNGKLNAKLIFDCNKAGTYKLFAAALKGTGAYTLKVTEGKGKPGGGDDVKGIDLKVGKKVDGKLNQNVKTIAYKIRLEAGKSYVIDMTSPDQMALDPFLILKDAKGKELDRDDDGGEGLNARIRFSPTATGVYIIEATSFGQSGDGDFSLEVQEKE